MAVDTRNKRASVLGIVQPCLPLPDASVDDADRQHVAYAYAGIAADPPVPPDPGEDLGDMIGSDLLREHGECRGSSLGGGPFSATLGAARFAA